MRLLKKLSASRAFPFVLFGIGVIFMMIGIFVTKENTDVLNKAVRICLECIGIG